METLSNAVSAVDSFVWGPVMLVLLVGTGIYLTIRTGFLPWRNLGYALKSTLSKEARKKTGEGDISPFSALTTALAATIGTGNIVGVATAMVSGGPMYTMKKAIKNKALGSVLGWFFAFFTVIASFGIGNMTQANSITSALNETFSVPSWAIGIILTLLSLLIIVGGIKSISKVSQVVVPVMAIFYMIAALSVIIGNIGNLPAGVSMIFKMAFSVQAVGGGLCGTITASMMNAMRFGVARGVFSNEAGMGSAAITAAAATTDHPVRQAYINMTGTFWDTIVVCTMTGLAIASSGVLGGVNPATGELYQGSSLTIAAFATVLGPAGGWLVSIGITLFAFSTILGWEYHGEKAYEYILGTHKYNMIYRVIFSLVVFVGCVATLDLVWNLSDIANALMAIPNLICMLILSGEISKDIREFQDVLKKEKMYK